MTDESKQEKQMRLFDEAMEERKLKAELEAAKAREVRLVIYAIYRILKGGDNFALELARNDAEKLIAEFEKEENENTK